MTEPRQPGRWLQALPPAPLLPDVYCSRVSIPSLSSYAFIFFILVLHTTRVWHVADIAGNPPDTPNWTSFAPVWNIMRICPVQRCVVGNHHPRLARTCPSAGNTAADEHNMGVSVRKNELQDLYTQIYKTVCFSSSTLVAIPTGSVSRGSGQGHSYSIPQHGKISNIAEPGGY
ncbi:hypothetical protein B0T21DRAFT_353745 [Apiosordaria backusii]|uniref:Uncharacterized protein n=1 Tax=Apiosordaria backusii TaxID=314023 RepID=A0AA39ZQ07_9PEZI|nr:hypothetical protein B0T21DRAFT_353745 [Apiosordaria backusii]